MILNKTQYKIIELFVANITKQFSIREISRLLDINVSLVHRNINPLSELNLISKDDKGFLKLNYRNNHEILSYCEYLRRNSFLKKNKLISLMNDDVIKKFPYDSFISLIFGSTIKSKKPNDLDLLIIIEKTEDIEQAELYLNNILNNYTLPIHLIVISFESVDEMLALREQKNVMNEVLNKHIILYGAELFYKLVNRGRK